MKNLACYSLILIALCCTKTHAENEIGYMETFALAKDRTEALKQLIPGTDDYYYYHLLHYQQTEQKKAYDDMLALWKKRNNGNTPSRARELINRQALLDYPTNSKHTLEHLIRSLNLKFNHERRVEGKLSTLPSALDPNRISTETLTKRALSEKRNLSRFTDRGLPLVAGADLSPDQRRNLLSRLHRPNFPNLVKLIAVDLAYKNSKGFGSLDIHRKLTLAQLDELVAARETLRNEQTFVETYLRRLAPSADENIERDSAAHQALLDRMWLFASTLSPAHNSLKATILYRQLELSQKAGTYDPKRFMAYIKLPRAVHYANPDWLKAPQNKNFTSRLNERHPVVGQIGSDEALVSDYLRTYLVGAKNTDNFAPYFNSDYLKKAYARANIEAGKGNVEKWASMLSPSEYQALKERVDIQLAPENPESYAPDAPVKLLVDVKNVTDLLVKVFEINTFNYYRDQQREVDLAVNLDGLIASSESRKTYNEAPERRVRRSFEFPELNRRGVFVVEFIGNGQSSRALISKGRLHYLSENTAAGHRFTVLNEANEQVKDAKIWLGSRVFEAGEDGRILVPYSTNPKEERIILQQNDFASVARFNHQAENYELNVGFYVDREALLSGQNATVLVKPTLRVSGAPTSVQLLNNVTLDIETTNLFGIKTQKSVPAFALFEDRESAYEFKVPEDLQQIQFTLKAEVQNISTNKKESKAASQSFALNDIDRGLGVDFVHIVRSAAGYHAELLGKSGEARAGKVLHLEIKHRDFTDRINLSLQSNEQGRCDLGDLVGIEWIQFKSHDDKKRLWQVQQAQQSLPDALHGTTDMALTLPFWSDAPAPLEHISLFEVRSNTFVADHSKKLSWQDGLLGIAALPAGDYTLRIEQIEREIPVRIAAGVNRNGFAISSTRKLGLSNTQPVHIQQAKQNKKSLTISLANASPFTRVHVYAHRYEAEYRAFDQFGFSGFPGLQQMNWALPRSFYVSGRNIGDEYRYILERQQHQKYPGNLLERPGLLLNPWAVRDTDAGEETLAKQGLYESKKEASMPAPKTLPPAKMSTGTSQHYANIDYLKTPSVLLSNLNPNKQGDVVIPLEALGDKTQATIVVVDPTGNQVIQVPLPEQPLQIRDRRLILSLDPAKHLTEQRMITHAPKGKPFVIKDVTTSTYEAYGSLAAAYQLLLTLNNNETLREFAFITDWPNLEPEEKGKKYSTYASHELHFFLYHKDRAFFDQVIAPYLANKKDQTFLDHWLLEHDLTDYLQPWQFNRLNIVERILLGKRIKAQHPALERHVRELNELLPPRIESRTVWFDTASNRSGLETKSVFFRFAGVASDKSINGVLAIDGGDIRKYSVSSEIEKVGELMEAEEAVTATAGKVLDAKMHSKRNARPRITTKPASSTAYFDTMNRGRQSSRAYFRKLDSTREWAENNYHHLRIEQQVAGLVNANGYWADYAAHEGKGTFLSDDLAATSGSFTEMMLALAVLDLPFKEAEHTIKTKDARFEITPGNDLLVFHKEIRETELAADRPPMLVSQQFFRYDDRYRYEGNQKLDKYVEDEFLRHVVYGCQVILTNPTSTPQKLDVLLQIPRGAMQVNNGFRTKGRAIQLNAYSTQTIEYLFYFPGTGEFPHYPVHVTQDQDLIAHAPPLTFNVVEKLTKLDKTSWAYLSQHGNLPQVLAFLEQHNIERLNLDDIAWRMQEKAAFKQIIAALHARHKYHHTLWMYGVKHNDPEVIQEYLRHTSFASQCGYFLESPLLSLNPVDRHVYQHLEYAPLVNARAHQVGKEPTILNHRFRAQYQQFLRYLSYKAASDDTDRLATTYYLALQDRIAEALSWFGTVQRGKVSSGIQYDYMNAYLGMYEAKFDQARNIANNYAKYPVPRWQNKFLNVLNQLENAASPVDPESRDQAQEQLAASEPAIDFSVAEKLIQFKYQNVARCTVNFYPMDIELLFSRNPFIKDQSSRFSYIRPVLTRAIDLPVDQESFKVELPQQFQSANVMIEVVAAGQQKLQAYYANALNPQLSENYGQIRITHLETATPLDTVYVKVYARKTDGSVAFFKDGYTDFRGRFDYVSLNSNELDNVARFALLVMSKEHGATILEAQPPKR